MYIAVLIFYFCSGNAAAGLDIYSCVVRAYAGSQVDIFDNECVSEEQDV